MSTIEELVVQIKKSGDSAAWSELFEKVDRYICSIARRYSQKAEIDDLRQEGYLALYLSIDRYEPARGVKFLSYATPWIKERMQRYIQGSFHIPEQLRKYRKLCTQYEMETGESLSDKDAAAFMGVTIERIGELQRCDTVASLDALIDEDGTTLGELVPDGRDQYADVIEDLNREALWDCVDRLPDPAPMILRRHYRNGETLADISRRTGLKYSRVKDVRDRALRQLRRMKDVQEIDEIYSAALKGNGAGEFNRTWTSSTERTALHLIDK